MADNKQENPRDGLALIVGGLFILALVFAAYNYFNKEGGSTGVTEEATNTSVIERIKEAISPESNDLNGNGAKDSIYNAAEPETTVFGEWVANDYEEGDISSGTYTVRDGDTLWEIAEAVYGDGFQWTKILDANSSSVGYLPNGEQALITTGQVIAIP